MDNMQMGQQGPIQNPQQDNTQSPVAENKHYKSLRVKRFITKFVLIIVALLLILAVVGGVYAYIMKIGPFAVAPYTEKNLLSGILKSVSNIKSSSYTVSASFNMDKRETDAKPFVSTANTDALKRQYENDYQRSEDLNIIIPELRMSATRNIYPSSLQSILEKIKTAHYSSYYKNISIIDPLTQQPYKYSITDGGKNFTLVVTFETNDAISSIKKEYGYSSSTTAVNGETVTFTKDSPDYIYLSPTPPDPFLISLQNSLSALPDTTKVSGSVSAQADWANKDSADWKFNMDATGDLGDLTYKVNVDALRKAQIYYFRINNMPGIFMGMLGFDKDQWIKVDPNEKPATSSYDYNSSMTTGIPDTEKYYKEHRQEIEDLLQKMVTIADDDNLIAFKDSPRPESVGGKTLFRYDLQIQKDAIVKFYKDFEDAVSKSGLNDGASMLVDSGYVNYLQSPEFSEIFDYYQKNTSLTLWADSQGYPEIVSYDIRIVPQDSATQLKDKQADVNFTLKIGNINEPVDIQAPKDAKDIYDYLKTNPYLSNSVLK